MARIKQTEESTPVVPTTEVTPVDNASLSQIIERLNRLERENAELKQSKENSFEKQKEKYKWPLKARYWLWAGVPIVSYETVKKNEEYDFLYKDGNGQWVNNHYVQLTLLNGEKPKKVLRDSFDTAKIQSELEYFDVITDRGDTVSNVTADDLQRVKPQKYVFHTKEHGDVTVDFNCIN